MSADHMEQIIKLAHNDWEQTLAICLDLSQTPRLLAAPNEVHGNHTGFWIYWFDTVVVRFELSVTSNPDS